MRFGERLQGIKPFIIKHIEWVPRAAVIFVGALIAAHTICPKAIDALGQAMDLEKPSLTSMLALVVSTIILDIVVTTRTELRNPRIEVIKHHQDAYDRIANYVREISVSKIDLLQFSGFNAREILEHVAAKSPEAHVRVLLMDPNEAGKFDGMDHPTKVRSTEAEITSVVRLAPQMDITLKYYNSIPGVSAVIFDDAVCIGWYHAYREAGKLELHGHRSPAIVAFGDAARDLRVFGQEQFDKVWNDPSTRPVSVAITGAFGAASATAGMEQKDRSGAESNRVPASRLH